MKKVMIWTCLSITVLCVVFISCKKFTSPEEFKTESQLSDYRSSFETFIMKNPEYKYTGWKIHWENAITVKGSQQKDEIVVPMNALDKKGQEKYCGFRYLRINPSNVGNAEMIELTQAAPNFSLTNFKDLLKNYNGQVRYYDLFYGLAKTVMIKNGKKNGSFFNNRNEANLSTKNSNKATLSTSSIGSVKADMDDLGGDSTITSVDDKTIIGIFECVDDLYWNDELKICDWPDPSISLEDQTRYYAEIMDAEGHITYEPYWIQGGQGTPPAPAGGNNGGDDGSSGDGGVLILIGEDDGSGTYTGIPGVTSLCASYNFGTVGSSYTTTILSLAYQIVNSNGSYMIIKWDESCLTIPTYSGTAYSAGTQFNTAFNVATGTLLYELNNHTTTTITAKYRLKTLIQANTSLIAAGSAISIGYVCLGSVPITQINASSYCN